MSASRTQVVDVTYDDYRTGERRRERKVRDLPFEEFEEVRNRELVLFEQPGPPVRARSSVREQLRDQLREQPREQSRYDDDEWYVVRRKVTRGGFAPPDRLDVAPRRSIERYDQRRRDQDSSDSSSDSSRDRRRRRHRHRRARSEQPPPQQDSDDDGGRLFYSMKKRKDGNILERHLDSSYDGLLAAVAGAAIGGMTARRFGGEEKRGLKIAAGTLLGAAGFNLVENHYRVYTEEREERKKEKEEEKFDARQAMEMGGRAIEEGANAM